MSAVRELAPLARTATRLHPRPGSPLALVDEWHEGPNAMVPVIQLYVHAVPLLRPPGQADLLQVLWCPFEHPPEYKPPTALFWRSTAEVTDVLAAPPDDSYEVAPQDFYPSELSDAPGWKVGGWPPWGLTDPVARFCTACGAEMGPPLTIASNERDAGSHGWVPYVCPESPDHPHTDLIQ